MRNHKLILLTLFSCFLGSTVFSQENEKIIRIARLEIDSLQLEAYQGFLKTEIKKSLQLEPGVLLLYAVYEKDHPNKITILEIYENLPAYQNHIRSPHFLEYKTGTEKMVLSLELIDTLPLMPGLTEELIRE